MQGKAGEKLRRGRMMGGSCCLWREVQVLEKGRVWGSPLQEVAWRSLRPFPGPRAGGGPWSLGAGAVIDGDLPERVCLGSAGVLWVLDLVQERFHSGWC